LPKKQLKKILPTHEKIKEQKMLKIFGNFLYKPSLWSLSRKKVLMGVFIGVFVCFIPMPFQMFLSSFLAILLNANLPISFILIFISNPITMPPLFYFNYKVGAWALSRPVLDFDFKLSWAWISERLLEIGVPLYLGSLIVATVAACLAYLIIQLLWRRKIRSEWRARRCHKSPSAHHHTDQSS
jgi:uncharacterized protein (DUF2062 family)